PGLRRRHHRGPRFHRHARRHQHERASARAGTRGGHLLLVHLRYCLCHHPRGRGRTHHQRLHFLRPHFWTNVIHRGEERKPGEEVRVARISAFVVGAIAMAIAILLGPTANVAFLVALAFAVAASANLPVIVLSIFWRRFNTAGAVAGLGVGLIASIGLILVGPSLMAIDPPTVTGAARHLIQAKAWFPLENPGILSIP